MSSDPITLDLFRIHHDADLLATLHRLQVERLAERAITANERPAGMRLSIPDPVRRVKAAFDPFWTIPFNEGVGMRGHLLEDYLEVALFHGEYPILAGKSYRSQVAIQWHEAGRSAFDFVVDEHEGAERVISCKSSIKDTKPSSANRAQEARMLTLAGYPAGTTWETWMLNPSTFRAVGPYIDTLTQEQVDAATDELAAVTKAYAYWGDIGGDPTTFDRWNDPAFWLDQFGLESTSGAFRLDRLDASGAVEARNRAYLRARARLAEAKADEEAAKALIRTHVEEQLALNPGAKTVLAYSGDCVASYSVDKRGAMRCTEKPLEAEAAA